MSRLRIRHAALLFCALVLAFAVLFAALAIGHGVHQCTGHECPICLWFYRAVKFLRQMVLMLVRPSFGAGLWALPFAAFAGAISRNRSASLSSLKVRLNN